MSELRGEVSSRTGTALYYSILATEFEIPNLAEALLRRDHVDWELIIKHRIHTVQ